MYLLYSCLFGLGLLLTSPYWLLQAFRHGKYRKGFLERLGRVPVRLRHSTRPSIWVHAVSVGEVLAVSELVFSLRREFSAQRIVVSTTTVTGQKLAKSRFGAEDVFYFPLDFAFSIQPWITALQPQLIVIAETEFWPNFLRLAHSSGARVLVTNARISDRSFPGYRRWRALLQRILRGVDLFLAQSSVDAQRLIAIGAPAQKVIVAGNLKYDALIPPELPIVSSLRQCLRQSNAGPVLVCGSTVEGEEEILLQAFATLLVSHPKAVMLLAPRHPERFPEVAELIEKSKLTLMRRSSWNGEPVQGGVLLIDSIGELASLYALADVAFVGGSLVPRGGHNILEPALHGVPILVGEHTDNFRDIVELFESNGAVRVVSPKDVASTLLALLADDAERRSLGARAKETLAAQQGATGVTLQKIRELLDHTKKAAPA